MNEATKTPNQVEPANPAPLVQAERLVMPDGCHCDPECPLLIYAESDPTNELATCGVDGEVLDWYDFWLASCEYDKA